MRSISDINEKAAYLHLLDGLTDRENSTIFSTQWIEDNRWKVVPVEDTSHFALEEIDHLMVAIRKAGYSECLALATEPVSLGSEVYILPITEIGFRNFNAKCGVLRYLLTVENRSWAISCGEWFNLFAAPTALLEEMLGRSIDAARADFMSYARLLATDKDRSALAIAEHYAVLG